MAGTAPSERPAAPTWRKLGLREDSLLALVHPPDGWALSELPAGAVVTRTESVSEPSTLVVAFFRAASELREASDLASAIFPDGAIWAAWPRKGAGHESDLSDNVVRAAALEIGLVDVKVAMIDVDWSGLRLVWRVENRPPGRRR